MDLRELVASRARRCPDATAVLRPDGAAYTFAAINTLVDRVAAALPGPARRVAVVIPNDEHGVAAIHAVWRHGGSVALLSPALPPAEVQRRIAESGCDTVLDVADGTAAAPSTSSGGVEPVADEAAIIFTSGTTGRPKGAVLSFAGIASALGGIGAAIGSEAGRLATIPARSPSPVFMSLAHIGGFLGSLNAFYQGKPLLLVDRFRVGEVFDLVERFRLTLLRLSPAMLHDLAHWPEPRSLAPVRTVSVGSAALSDATRRRFEERYAIPVLNNYGQTELSGAIAFERYEDVRAGRRPPQSVGRIAPGVAVRIVDDDGHEVPPGTVGEIWARGGSELVAYIDAGASVDPRRDGWVPTGDLGWVDGDEFLYLAGRTGDVIVCGGFNVYPAMVEVALNRQPGVSSCVVVGVPDDRLGEIPVAVVEPIPGEHINAEQLRAALRTELAAYEVPRRFAVVDRIPLTDGCEPDREQAAELARDAAAR